MIAGIKLFDHLTPRQTELGLLLALGLTTAAISKRMGIKQHTISAEITKTLNRFIVEEDFSPRTAFTLWCYEHRDPLYKYLSACKSGQAWEEPWEICEREMERAS